MAQRITLLALGFAALLACCSPPASTTSTTTTSASASIPADQGAGAAGVVTNLYQPYLKHQSDAPAWYQALPMTPQLAALVEKDQANTQPGDEGAIDADPIIAAQDFELTDLSVAPDAPFANGRGVITAHFNNMGNATAVHYDMVERTSDHAWLVDNVRSGASDLRAALEPPPPH